MTVAAPQKGCDRIDTIRPVAPQSGRRRSRLRLCLVGTDVAALALACLPWPMISHHGAGASLLLAALFIVVSLAAIDGQRLYLARVCAVRSVEIARLGRAMLLATGVVAIVTRSVTDVPLALVVAHGAVAFVCLVLGRRLFSAWLDGTRANGHNAHAVAFVGMNDEAAMLCRLLSDEPQLGYRVVGVVCPREALPPESDLRWLGPVERAADSLHAAGIDGVVLTVSALRPAERAQVIRSLLDAGVHVQVSIGLERVYWRRLRAVPLGHEPVFYLEPRNHAAWQAWVKRGFDVVFGTVALVLSLPIMAAAAIAILVTDGGGVIYRQTRVGRDGVPFQMLKLRTMTRDADDRLHELREHNERRDSPLFKMADDPRILPIGRLLRPIGLDELPQLWNVLRGEMTLVGPRPALPEECAEFDAELRARFCVRPGITGLWQLEARSNPSFELYRYLDLFYLENRSLIFDLAIMIATLELLLGKTLGMVRPHHSRRELRVPEVAREPTASLDAT